MSTQSWKNGWTADDPPAIGFAWAAKGDGELVPREGDGFAYRDLNVGAASDGVLGVCHVKAADRAVSEEWRALDADFDFIYVLTGTATLENEDGDKVPLEYASAAVQPQNYRYRITRASDDFSFVHVTAPASYDVTHGNDGKPRGGAAPRHAPVYTQDSPDQYTKGNGPREYFLYRDLGTTGPTEGRIHFHIVRASEPGPGTGWHYHTMAQWFMVVGGTATIRVEDRPHYPLTPRDAMCVGRGPQMRHNVTKFSGDYAILELCTPAEYDTIAVGEPDGADTD
jgi:mannose-6-phosphate isomerase-like protein (cupin superfamily)